MSGPSCTLGTWTIYSPDTPANSRRHIVYARERSRNNCNDDTKIRQTAHVRSSSQHQDTPKNFNFPKQKCRDPFVKTKN